MKKALFLTAVIAVFACFYSSNLLSQDYCPTCIGNWADRTLSLPTLPCCPTVNYSTEENRRNDSLFDPA
ncbi:MAG: hypothetical protein NT007_18185 [Candidatus Kapabacteria bacterium]|nr:hypothetical protein [Candidatus Kapabacteria bacterium]